MKAFDVFVSYAHADRERVLELRDALDAQQLSVWLDDREIETFASISAAIESALAHSKVLLAFYSQIYPTRRACQWELTAAFLASQRADDDPRARVLVINPERDAGHIEPVELRDARFAPAPAPGDAAALEALARRIAEHLAGIDCELGALGVTARSPLVGRRPVGASRFVGRVQDMWSVHSALCAGDVGLITSAHGGDPAVKVTGMGGIGKSLLAQEYALRFAAAYPGGVFWLRAHGHDDRGDVLTHETRDAERDTQLLAFARHLEIDVTDLAPEALPGVIGGEVDRRAQPFLWIVDDVPPGLGSRALESWYAPGRFGRTLITTRTHEYRGVGTQIDIGVLSLDEGYELLVKHRVPDGDREQEAARRLVGDLGAHALAVDVAGAALAAERGVRSFAQYRGALADDIAVLEVAAALVGELPDGHEASIAATLTRSIRQLTEPALDFLRLASRLAVDPIPAALVVSVFAHVDDIGEDQARDRAVTAMHETAERSLADATDDTGDKRVHTLISRTIAVLERASTRTGALADSAIEVLIDQLTTAVPSGVSAGASTLAHARHLAWPLLDPRYAFLLDAVAFHDSRRGDYRLARTQEEQVLAARRRLLGDEHPDTLTSRSSLAVTLGALGDHVAARTLHEQTLAARRRLLGDEHPDTLSSLNNLAGTLRALGDHVAARALHEQTLAARRRLLGDEHPDTLTSVNNLAAALRALGDPAGARELFEETLTAWRRLLGDEHPQTLTSMNNLAGALRALGDYAGARTLYEQTLAARRRLLGDEHPQTLTSMNNLAVTLGALGDHAAARPLLEQTLAARRRVLGDEHPDTLSAVNSLAATLGALGDHAAARPLLEQTLAARRRLLGDEHPNTLLSMNNLAVTLGALGDHAGARALHEHALAASRRQLGDEHPNTLRSTRNLAETLTALGEHALAHALCEHVLAASRRLLGDEHPQTLLSMNNLAAALGALGDHAGARALHEQTLAASRRVLGDEHPDTLMSMRNLAETLTALGEHALAHALCEHVLAAARRVLGDEHPDTLVSMNNLAVALGALGGDHAGARALLEQTLAAQRRVLGDMHPQTLMSMSNLADTLTALGDHAGASALLEDARPGIQPSTGLLSVRPRRFWWRR